MTTTVAPRAGDGPDLAKAARNGLVGFVGSGVAAVAGLLLNVVVGRSVGPAASGIFFVVVAVVTVVSTAGKLGADTGLVWALPRIRAQGRSSDTARMSAVALLPVAVASAALAAACFLGAGVIAERVAAAGQAESTGRLLRVAAPFVLLSALVLVVTAGLRGLGGIASFTVLRNIALPGLRLLLVAAALLTAGGLLGAVWAWCLPTLGVVVVGAVMLRRQAVRRAAAGNTRHRSWQSLFREFWVFASGRLLSSLMEIGIVWGDVLLVSALTGSREAGIYAAASRFVTTGRLVEASLRIAIGPELSSRLAVDDRDGAGEVVNATTQWIILLSWPLYIALGAYAPVLLDVFGPGFDEGARALMILCASMLVAMAVGNSQTVLLMSGRSLWQSGNKAAALAVNIGLNLVLVPRWGMEGAAVAWAVTILLDSAAVLVQVRYLVGVRTRLGPSLRAMGTAAATFVVPAVLVALTVGLSWKSTIVGVAGSSALHLGLVYVQRRHFDLGVLRVLARRRGHGARME